MAVITVQELGAAIRAGQSTEETAEVTRLHAYVTAAVDRYAPQAPDAIKSEAMVRLAGYLYDMPNAGRGMGYANTLRNSGAKDMLLPYRSHRAGRVEA